MRVVVVGMGIQGRKRLAVAGGDAIGTVDPVESSATFRSIEDVPRESYDAALVCTPDDAKSEVLSYLLRHGKHVLVEKPLVSEDQATLINLRDQALRSGTACYTAYNHRFEPHLATVKRLLDQDTIGTVYQARFFYGNGTARDVRNSPWRDRGLGVISDLASHMLDLVAFFFGTPTAKPELWAGERFENRAFDYFALGFPGWRPMIRMEGTLLSWRNTFQLDIIGERGSIHVEGLCKWGPTSLIVRDRKLPSGKPNQRKETLEQPDPTWASEYEHFKQVCAGGRTNIDTDLWINGVLTQLAARLTSEPVR